MLHYDSTKELVSGNGSTLPVQNTGSFSISTPSNTFYFSNILYFEFFYPVIDFVNKIILDTSMEFLPSLFRVKELLNRTIHIQGRIIKSGVYESSPSPPRVTNYSPKSRMHDWHHLLGHPSLKI